MAKKKQKLTVACVQLNSKQSVSNNLLNTKKGERFFQPTLGLNLQRFLFEQFTDEMRLSIQSEIVDTFKFWLPFVNVTNIEINMDDSYDAVGKNKMNIVVYFNIVSSIMCLY